ncbi:hypothetical protein, variant [Verruconis gallopava]|nr:hypothetical protein, variant [Verruconis gallopava]KIW08879.1 hypothetical protein, variant [Verruconis gallopava]
MELSGCNMVWTSQARREIIAFDVCTGRYHTVSLPGRFSCVLHAVTSSFVVVSPRLGLNIYGFDLANLDARPTRLLLPAEPAKTAFHKHMAAFLLRKTRERLTHFDDEVVIWDMRSRRSYSFTLFFSKDILYQYCRNHGQELQLLTNFWVHVDSGILTFVYLRFSKALDYLFISIIQTGLKGDVSHEAHLQIQSHCEVRDVNFECYPESRKDSGRVLLAIQHSLSHSEDCQRSIIFEIDTSSTPPLYPSRVELWLYLKRPSELVSFKYKYEGLQNSPGGEESQSFHTYSISEKPACISTLGPGDSQAVKCSAVPGVPLSSRQQSCICWQRFDTSTRRYVTYRATGRNQHGSAHGFDIIDLDVFAAENAAFDIQSTVHTRRSFEISFVNDGTRQAVDVVTMAMTEGFVVVQLLAERIDLGAVCRVETVFVVLIFDPYHKNANMSRGDAAFMVTEHQLSTDS